MTRAPTQTDQSMRVITRLLCTLAVVACNATQARAEEPKSPKSDGPNTVSANAEYADFYTGQAGDKPNGIDWIQAISVAEPGYCSDIKGDTTVRFAAPGLTKIEVLCWQQPSEKNPNPFGHDEVVATISLDAAGTASFVFHADDFPNGPITLRIHGKDAGTKQDLCQLQLFTQGGKVWNQGIPKTDPPAAKGLTLLFADEFDKPLAISSDGSKATYSAHKNGGGDFSGWPFVSPSSKLNPFSQNGTWMRIQAAKPEGTKGATGLISSLRADGTGVLASAPCYFECRFLAQSAPGTWPAFWLCAKNEAERNINHGPCDELDIIEAYGGMGPKNPNFVGYAWTSHFWGQPKQPWQSEKGPDGKALHPIHQDASIMTVGGRSSWSTTFHTYGCLITKTDTVYYFDDIEVARHPSGEHSKTMPFWFLIDYAIGGISGWHVDLARYGMKSDMWVDYVRVYHGGTPVSVPVGP